MRLRLIPLKGGERKRRCAHALMPPSVTTRREVCSYCLDLNYKSYILFVADKKKRVSVSLVEEDIQKLKYEVTYAQDQQQKESLNLNRLVKCTNPFKFCVSN